MAPDEEPIQIEGTETVRSVGGFWITGESTGPNPMTGDPFTGIITLGYDPEKGHYSGTWIDSMNNYLWTYKGSLDKSGKLLTLETEGPCPGAPGQYSKFREVLEIKSPNHKVFTSSIQGEDGKWIKMVKVDSRRKS